MKYGPGITFKYSNCNFSFYYKSRDSIIAQFCARDFRRALGIHFQWEGRLRVIAYDRAAKNRIEVRISRVDYFSALVEVREGHQLINAWTDLKGLYNLGIEPKEDTYFWLEVK